MRYNITDTFKDPTGIGIFEWGTPYKMQGRTIKLELWKLSRTFNSEKEYQNFLKQGRRK